MSVKFGKLEEYAGNYVNTYATYALDDSIRIGAASGGTVTAILIYLLENGYVDGVFVSRQKVIDGELITESSVATDREQILDCRTSIYTYFPLEKSLDKIIEFDGKVAGVFLPCNLKAIEVLEKKEPLLKQRLIYKIGLFCGGVAQQSLMKKVMEKNNIDMEEINRIFLKKGHWRGNTHIELKSGETKVISYTKNWCTYKNAYFYSSPKCLNCNEFFNKTADFECGDIWLKEMKEKEIKHTGVISKNSKADDIINEMINKKVIKGDEINSDKILQGNKRALIYKFYTPQARKKLGKYYGFNYSKEIKYKSNWNHYLASILILFNMKLSKSDKAMKIIFKIPKQLMYLYMCFIRLLLSK